MKKLAIFFPGIGYTKDKPLLYYSRKLAREKGYDEVCVEYNDLPENVKGNPEKKKEALLIAYKQACEELSVISLSEYDEVLIVGKSLGSVVAAKYHEEKCTKARLVLYTPVEATFRFKINEGIAFIGDNDSWSDLSTVEELADNASIPLYIYPGCNHSMEVSNNCVQDIEHLRSIMEITNKFIK